MTSIQTLRKIRNRKDRTQGQFGEPKPEKQFGIKPSKMVNYMDRRSYSEMKVDFLAQFIGFYTARKNTEELLGTTDLTTPVTITQTNPDGPTHGEPVTVTAKAFDFDMDGEITENDSDVLYYYREQFPQVVIQAVMKTTSSDYHFRVTAFDSILVDGKAPEILVEPDTQELYVVIGNAGTHDVQLVAKELVEEAFRNETCLISANISGYFEGVSKNAFSGCSNLTAVTLPNSPYRIEGAAFTGCTKLAKINIPPSVKIIDSTAFTTCSNLKNLTWGPSGVNNDPYAVLNPSVVTTICKGSLSSVTIMSNVVIVKASAFKDCVKLNKIDFPSDITTIESNAFSGCTGLGEVIVRANVTSIADNAFTGCSNITKITWASDYVSPYVVSKNCQGKLNTVILNGGIKTLKANAFSGCTQITTISIPSSLTTMESKVFAGCTGINYLIVPTTLTSIGENAFSGCTGINGIEFCGGTKTIKANTFVGCSNISAMTWSSTTNPSCVTQYCSGKLAQVTVTGSVQTIPASAFKNCTGISTAKLSVTTNVTSVGANAFEGCTNTGFTGITMNNVTSVGTASFCGCTSLKTVTMPKLATIGASAFEGCTALQSFAFNSTATTLTIGSKSFKNTGLKSVSIPENATVNESAFESCTQITDITVYNVGSEKLSDSAFTGCANITGMTWGCNNVSPYRVTKYCRSNLRNVTLSASTLTRVGGSAFLSCTSITEIVVPSNVTTIATKGFAGCTGLVKVTVCGATSVEADSFTGCTSITSLTWNSSLNVCDKVLTYCKTSIKTLNLGTKASSLPGGSNCSLSDCTSLTSLIMNYGGVVSLNDTLPDSCTSIKVPSSYVSSYKSNAKWSVYADKISAI